MNVEFMGWMSRCKMHALSLHSGIALGGLPSAATIMIPCGSCVAIDE